MRAELRLILPNDFLDWDLFVASDRPDPWNDCGSFSLDIGAEGEPPEIVEHPRNHMDWEYEGMGPVK